MKICKNCGAENFEINTECEKCKQPLLKEHFTPPTYQEIPNATSNDIPSIEYYSPASNGLSIAAKVIMIINTSALGLLSLFCFISWIALLTSKIYELRFFAVSFFICTWISIAFTIITLLMTVSYAKKINLKQPISTSFKVCTLLFVSFLAGILMLCDSKNGQKVVIQAPPKANAKVPTEELREYKALLDSGIISEEEFEKKKKQILGL